MKAKVNLKNTLAYLQGKYRYLIFYKPRLKWLIRPHIRQQIESRIQSMDIECYLDGQCKMCGCETTALQMTNKACDKPCYPKMMTKSEWRDMKKGAIFVLHNISWKLVDNKFTRLR